MIKFNIKKIKVQISLSFFLLIAIMIALNYIEQFFILFFVVTIHELTHVIVAAIFGIEPEKIVISPIGEVAVLKELNSLSYIKKNIVILAGPMINLLLFVSTTIIFKDRFNMFKTTNLSIAIFNLLPMYPLDGGKFLQSVISNHIGVIPSNKILLGLSKVLSKIIILIGLIQFVLFPPNASLILIGIFIDRTVKQESLNITFEFYSQIIIRKNKLKMKKIIPIKKIIYRSDAYVKEMIYRICWDCYYMFYLAHQGVIEEIVSEEEIIDYVLENGLEKSISQMILDLNDYDS